LKISGAVRIAGPNASACARVRYAKPTRASIRTVVLVVGRSSQTTVASVVAMKIG